MIRCGNCNHEMGDGAKFCTVCGEEIERKKFCVNCGAQMPEHYMYCDKCGAVNMQQQQMQEEIAEQTEAEQTEAEQTEVQLQVEMPRKSSINKKWFIGIGVGVGVLAIVIIAVVCILFTRKSEVENYGVYLKDNELYYKDYSNDEEIEVTMDLVAGENYSDVGITFLSEELSYFVTFSEDNNRIFYPESVEQVSTGVTLYYKDLNDSKSEGEEIDTEILLYAIDNAGTEIVYTKGESKDLYISDLNDKEKIGTDIMSLNVSDDLERIGYQTFDGDYYIWTEERGSEKIISNPASISYITEDLSAIYYMEDDTLYKKVIEDNSNVMIASNVGNVFAVYETGEVYYTVMETTRISLMDYVIDELAESDAACEEPVYPEMVDIPGSPWSPYGMTYDSVEEELEAYEAYEAEYEAYQEECAAIDEINLAAIDAYEIALEDYEEVENRNELREDLENGIYETSNNTLYYYDGNESTVALEYLAKTWLSMNPIDLPILAVEAYEVAETTMYNITDINYADEIFYMLEDAFNSVTSEYVVIGGVSSTLGENQGSYYRITEDGSMLYYLVDQGNGYGELYTVSINNGSLGTVELYDTNVSDGYIDVLDNGSFIYYKNMSEDYITGDLYIDGEKINSDVRSWYVDYDEENDTYYYYSDWNDYDTYGTLNLYHEGENTEISKDVTNYVLSYDGSVQYLCDYNMSDYTGTLYIYQEGESVKVDDGVTGIIDIYDRDIMGGIYSYFG